MKRFPLLILILFVFSGFRANSKIPDSLTIAYQAAKTDTGRIDILWEIANRYAQNKPDSQLLIAQEAILISKRINYLTGERRALKQMAEAYQYMGNYPLALQYYLQRLKMDENTGIHAEEVVTLLSIANLYQSEGDYHQALVYAKKGYALIQQFKLEDYRWYSYMVFGDTYEKMNNVPDAIYYNRLAYNLALKNKNNAWLGMCLNNTGNAFVKAGQLSAALNYYYKCVPYLKASQNGSFLCESYQGIAGILYKTGKLDSAVFYAKQSLNLAINRGFNQKYLRSCQLLTNIYKAKHLPDSALTYQGKLLVMKDFVYSQDKEKQIASLTIAEQIRQKELTQLKLDEEKHRSYVLNMLLVGLLIPFSFLISLVVSKKKMHHKVIEFSGVISLLLLFEYLTILLHPLVERWTNNSPFLEIMIFVVVAAILTPSHHRLEHWMLSRLTQHIHHKNG